MKITIKTDVLLSFLKKCLLPKLTKDMVLFAKDKGIYARLADKDKSFYFEVYEDSSLKVTEEGFIAIANLEKVIACLQRIRGDVVAIKSNESEFLITDGTKPIKFMQITEEVVESYIKKQIFKKDSLTYVEDCKFERGIEIEFEQLNEILGDAKAFGIESYNFYATGDDCFCKIEDKQLNQNIKSKLKIIKQIADESIYNVSIGIGFREIITVLGRDKKQEKQEDKNIIQIFTATQAILITSPARKFFYCLHCI
jgi:hypothetical protein